jgi:hypothetical protein
MQMDDFNLVGFLPLDPTDETSMEEIVLQIDMAIQYGEDLEPREPREEDEDGDAAAASAE